MRWGAEVIEGSLVEWIGWSIELDLNGGGGVVLTPTRSSSAQELFGSWIPDELFSLLSRGELIILVLIVFGLLIGHFVCREEHRNDENEEVELDVHSTD